MANRMAQQPRRRNPRRRAATASRLRRLVNRVSLGARITPSTDPPVYTAGPWWPLTLVDSVAGDTDFTPEYIHKGILDMLSLTGAKIGEKALVFKFRVLSVRAWGMAKQPIQLAVTETHGTKSNWVKEINDFGTPVNYSRVGWRFGDVFIQRVFTSTETQTLFQVAQAGTTDKILVYIQVLIRVPNAPDPAAVMAHIPVGQFSNMEILG